MGRTVSDWLVRFGALGLVVMTAIVGWQVFGRFVLDSSPSWTEQAALVLMIWYVMFAAARTSSRSGGERRSQRVLLITSTSGVSKCSVRLKNRATS